MEKKINIFNNIIFKIIAVLIAIALWFIARSNLF
jgi:hypothetical protein